VVDRDLPKEVILFCFGVVWSLTGVGADVGDGLFLTIHFFVCIAPPRDDQSMVPYLPTPLTITACII
jgi:hypothetical protein